MARTSATANPGWPRSPAPGGRARHRARNFPGRALATVRSAHGGVQLAERTFRLSRAALPGPWPPGPGRACFPDRRNWLDHGPHFAGEPSIWSRVAPRSFRAPRPLVHRRGGRLGVIQNGGGFADQAVFLAQAGENSFDLIEARVAWPITLMIPKGESPARTCLRSKVPGLRRERCSAGCRPSGRYPR